ncbi:alpha/beta fold hydrolase [Microbacterium sp. NPDC056234]|uniref:alpha/beta fold hydrolase n=1 Tax=Microbacterium sp. NPDC056234 TaxID=3345757 RepID=UPI0035DDF3BB
MDSTLAINGTRIFIDDRGRDFDRTLLFAHGGPGNSCWDFMEAVADRFVARGIRVVGVDQRGVLRSDTAKGRPPLTIELLIDDFEAIRRALGIDRWNVIGHSAGGAYALDYAIAHPDSVENLILDCPALDADSTDRFRLPRAAAMLDEHGMSAEAERCRQLASLDRRITADDRTWEAMLPLGNDYLDLFLFDAASRARYETMMARAPQDADWSRGASHLALLTDMYIDRRPALARVTVPSMLVHGERDLVASPDVIDAYRESTGGKVRTIAGAGHFAYVEQPDSYVDAVASFMQGAAVRSEVLSMRTTRHAIADELDLSDA